MLRSGHCRVLALLLAVLLLCACGSSPPPPSSAAPEMPVSYPASPSPDPVTETPVPSPVPTEKTHIRPEPVLYDDLLPESYRRPCPNAGTLLNWSYDTVDWETQEAVSRAVQIYLPHGWERGRQYNILVLLHGLGGSEKSWLSDPHPVGGEELALRTVLDNMIDEGRIEPLIVVCPSLYMLAGQGRRVTGYEQLAYELKDTILPHVAAEYGSYAASPEPEDLAAAREHFAIGGASWGSYYTYESGIGLSLPFFSGFLCFSGDGDAPWLSRILESPEYSEYDIALYYAAAGTGDVARPSEERCYATLTGSDPRLREGENAWLHLTSGGHDWTVWSTELFNALQLLF